MKQRHLSQHGFTLIELLIVIAIIAILAAVIIVALDPARRFQDTRDARRASDASELMTAIKLDQVDNGGAYASEIATGTAPGEIWLLGECGSGANGVAVTDHCTTNPTEAACLDLNQGSDDLLTEGYLADFPVSPNGTGSWDEDYTGYTLERESTGILTIRACENENTGEIVIGR